MTSQGHCAFSLNMNRDVLHPETMKKGFYHGLFHILLIIVSTCSVVITVNNLNSDVTLRKSGALLTYEDLKDF